MQELLFTFNSQQLTPTIIRHHPPPAAVSSTEPRPKLDLFKRNLRTKKMKKYNHVFEQDNIKRHMTEIDNEFIGLENITSENLIKISQFGLVGADRSVQTIETNNKLKRPKEISLSNGHNYKEKDNKKSLQYIWTPQDRRYCQLQTKIEEHSTRRRGFSLKEGPLVSYPSDQKKLPEVFRSKSITHNKIIISKRSIEIQGHKDISSKQHTPKSFKATKKIYYHFTRPLQSQKILPDTIENEKSKRSDCPNLEVAQLPMTPAFRAF